MAIKRLNKKDRKIKKYEKPEVKVQKMNLRIEMGY